MNNHWKLNEQEREMVERFEAAYNSIDRFLRQLLCKDRAASFMSLVSEFERTRYRLGRDADHLRMAGDLRNVLIHQKTTPYLHLAVPTLPVVAMLEAIRKRLTDPPPVIPRFQRPVESVKLTDSLAQVLKLIASRDYSQFPVYDGPRFCGLLTENGITRWLAHHVTNQLSIIELEDVPIKKVLPEEEARPRFLFIPRNQTVEAAWEQFAEKELLEAILITQTGARTETLLGIITRWDMIHKKGE